MTGLTYKNLRYSKLRKEYCKISYKWEFKNYKEKYDYILDLRLKANKFAEASTENKAELYNLCANDILYWFNVFCWTYDPRKLNEGLSPNIPFTLYEFQECALLEMEYRYRNKQDLLIDKSRDMGCSWITVLWLQYHWLFDKGFAALVGSRVEDNVDITDDTSSLMGKLVYNMDKLPMWFTNGKYKKKRHKTHLKMVNPNKSSTIMGQSTNIHFARGGRYSVIMLDEFAAVEKSEDIWVSAGQSSPVRIPVSTPCGLGNMFSQIRFSGKIECLSLHWTAHPDKSINAYYVDKEGERKELKDNEPYEFYLNGRLVRSSWYDRECERAVSNLEISQEIDIDYKKSGRLYFNTEKLYEYREKHLDNEFKMGMLDYDDSNTEIIFKEDKVGILNVWVFPDANSEYVIGSDVAEGLKDGDYSVASVVNRDTGEQVAVMRCLLAPYDYSYELYLLALYYNNAKLVVERNNHGHTVLSTLTNNYGYYNLYYDKRIDTNIQAQTKKYGFLTTGRSKYFMLDTLAKSMFKLECISIKDKRFFDEVFVFIVDESGKVNAASGHHDDIIISLALANLEVNYEVEEKVKEEDISSKIPRLSIGWFQERKKIQEKFERRKSTSKYF